MTTVRVSRREFNLRLAALLAAPAAVAAVVPTWLGAAAPDQKPGELSSDAESIHQVVAFDAPPRRVYETLIDAAQFSAMTKYSLVPNAPAARLAREPGAMFSLFDGHITGRNIEVIPDRRIVQAWRAADWDEGHYSIARFELAPRGRQTVVTFDHTGFPKGAGAHLVEGWYANYWTPLKKHLG